MNLAIHGGLPWREIYRHLACEYSAFPQRHMTGVATTTEETSLPQTFTNNIGASITVDHNGIYPMIKTNPLHGTHSVLTDKDLPAFLESILKNSTHYGRRTRTVIQDGKPSIEAGNLYSNNKGIVYKPTTQDQADRNLNFALANLAAFLEWERVGKAEAEARAKRDAELKAAQERRAKEQAAEEARKREENLRRIEREERDGINAYNKAMGTSYAKFSHIMFMGENAKKQWIALGKAQRQLADERLRDAIKMPILARPAFNSGSIFNNRTTAPRPFGY